jgi:hypothetical protein
MKSILRIIAILLFFPALSFSQTNELGIGIGAGTSEVTGPATPLSHYNFVHLGVEYYRTYVNELLCLKTGLSFDFRYKPNDKWPYLRMPLGLDVRIGKRFEAVAGAGIIFYYLPGMNYEYLKKFQLGWEVNSGIEYSFSDKFDINIMLQKNFDLSAMDLTFRFRTQGEYDIIDWIVSDNFIRIGVKYKFSGK